MADSEDQSKAIIFVSNETPASQRRSFTTSRIVNALIGPDQEVFHLHEHILCFHSDYFRASLNGSWQEATAREVRIEDAEPAVFSVIADWMYGKSFGKPNDMEEDHSWIPTLIKAHILANRLMMEGCENAIMDEIRRFYTDAYFHKDTINFIAETELPDTPLRQFFVDFISFELGHRVFKKSYADVRIEKFDALWEMGGMLTLDVMREFFDMRKQDPKDDPARILGCAYHTHKDDMHCGHIPPILFTGERPWLLRIK